MVIKFIPSEKGLGEISALATGEPEFQVLAKAILAKAQQLAKDAGLDDYEANLRIEQGVRPKGRGYVRVIADDPTATAVEYGDDDMERLRILGQASGVTIFPDAAPGS